MRLRALPTLLGALLLLLGAVAFERSRPAAPVPPAQVVVVGAPSTPFEATLVALDEGGERVRQATLSAFEEPGARLTESLKALRAWSLIEGWWPEALGAPRVFLVTSAHAVLDFPLLATPGLSAATEARLITSVRRTAARQGVEGVTFLVNGRASETLLGHVTLQALTVPTTDNRAE